MTWVSAMEPSLCTKYSRVAFWPLYVASMVSSICDSTDLHETVGSDGATLAVNSVDLAGNQQSTMETPPDALSTKEEPYDITLSPLKATLATALARGMPF